MPDKIDEAAGKLQQFSKDQKVEALEQAVESLEEFDFWSLAPATRLSARRRLLAAWSRTIAAIDRRKDPDFDPEKDQPLLRVAPSLSGVAAVDPEASAKLARRRDQILLLELDERALESAHRVCSRLYTQSPADRKEMDSAFEDGPLSPGRRAEILAGPKPKPAPPADPHEHE